MPGDLAKSMAVGKGREAPNTDPFLDPDNPELVDHRNMFKNSALGMWVEGVANAISSGARSAFLKGMCCLGFLFIYVIYYIINKVT